MKTTTAHVTSKAFDILYCKATEAKENELVSLYLSLSVVTGSNVPFIHVHESRINRNWYSLQ